MTQPIRITENGKPVSLDSLRPTAHSPTLDLAVQRMIGSGAAYRAAVAAEVARVNFTPAGRDDMARGHGRKALATLAEAFKQARQQAVGERDIAADRHSNAIKTRVRVESATVPVLIELAKQLKADPRLRGRLVQMVSNDDAVPDFVDLEYIEAGAVMPLAISGLTMPQRLRFRGYITPEENGKLARATEALEYVDQLAATLTESITADARLPMTAADPALVQAWATVDRRVAATLPDTMQTSPSAEVQAPTTNTDTNTGTGADATTLQTEEA